jgi:hypothetical protein
VEKRLGKPRERWRAITLLRIPRKLNQWQPSRDKKRGDKTTPNGSLSAYSHTFPRILFSPEPLIAPSVLGSV